MQIKKIALMATTIVGPLFAGNYMVLCLPDPDTQIGIEALYWQPCHYMNPYGLFRNGGESGSTTFLTTDFFALSPDYEWGFRLFGSIADKCQCNFALLEWIRVHGTTSATTLSKGRQLQWRINSTDLSKLFTSVTTNYDKVDLRLGHRFCGTKCSHLYVYGGGRYVGIHHRQRINGTNLDGIGGVSMLYNTRFRGGGIEVGLGATHELSCGLGVNARFGTLGVIGDKSYSFRRVETPLPSSSHKNVNKFIKGQSQCVGGYEFRVGIHGTYACGCCQLRGEVGYEYELYHRALVFLRDPGSTTSDIEIVESNFAMGGIYFGISVNF